MMPSSEISGYLRVRVSEKRLLSEAYDIEASTLAHQELPGVSERSFVDPAGEHPG